MGLAAGAHDSSLQRLSDTDHTRSGVEDDGDPVPARHQSDVSQRGNVPSTPKPQADVRRVALWHGREVMEVMPDQRCESSPVHGATAGVVIDHISLDIRLVSPCTCD
jgi:hypothetical protein